MFMWMHFLQLFAWKKHSLVKKEADLKYETAFRNNLYLEAELGFFISLADWG